jgi:hypothetical protein
MWKQGSEGAAFANGECTDVISGSTGCNSIKFIQSWCADHIKDEVELMTIIPARKEWSPCEELSENTANSPNVDSLQRQTTSISSFQLRQGTVKQTFVYILNDNMISGARYHLVATYSVISPASLPFGEAFFTLLASPKSQTLRSQLALSKRLAGLRSR